MKFYAPLAACKLELFLLSTYICVAWQRGLILSIVMLQELRFSLSAVHKMRGPLIKQISCGGTCSQLNGNINQSSAYDLLSRHAVAVIHSGQ